MKKKTFSIKQHLIIVVILMAVGLILNLVFPYIFSGKKDSPTASLVLDYGNGGVRKFTGEVIDYMTVLDAIWAASSGTNLKVEYGMESHDLSIDGRSDQIKIKLNSRPIPINMISQTVIARGDLIEIQLHE